MMMRVHSAKGGPEEEPSDEYILEGEYEKLKRSYRVMQNDYHRYKEECQRLLKKQNYLLSMLEDEKESVETDLHNMAQAIMKRRDEMNVQSLKELCEEHNDSAKEMEEENQNMRRLEGQIVSVEKQLKVEHRRMGGYYRLMDDKVRMQFQTGVFENRLQKAKVDFSTQLTLNRKLRQEIDHLRNERALYGGLYRRLSKELQEAKEELTDTIEISTQAFEQRDEAHNKMGALKERREKDMLLHNSEMKDLLRMINHEEKVKEFIQIKSYERNEFKVEKAKRIKVQYEKRGPAADKILLDNYDTAFKGICAVTKEEKVDIIIDNFMKNEEENFALYNYVNELSSETDELQAEINSLRESILKMHTKEGQRSKDWETQMNSIESTYQTKHREMMLSEKRLNEIHSVLDKLCEYVSDIFDKVGCDAGPIKSTLGGEGGITFNNVTIYMARIEARAMELLKSMYFLSMRATLLEGELPPKLDIGLVEPTLKVVPAVVPPASFEDEALDDEDDVTPLTEDELRARIDLMLERKENLALTADNTSSLFPYYTTKKPAKPAKKTTK